MSYEFKGFTQQGWQCPVCGAVYSPTTMFCMNCTGWKAPNNTENIKRKEWERIVDKFLENENEPKSIVKARKDLFMQMFDEFDDSQEGR